MFSAHTFKLLDVTEGSLVSYRNGLILSEGEHYFRFLRSKM